jgi:hypothetical protein
MVIVKNPISDQNKIKTLRFGPKAWQAHLGEVPSTNGFDPQSLGASTTHVRRHNSRVHGTQKARGISGKI